MDLPFGLQYVATQDLLRDTTLNSGTQTTSISQVGNKDCVHHWDGAELITEPVAQAYSFRRAESR